MIVAKPGASPIKADVVSHNARQLLTSPLLIRYLRYLESDVGGGLVARTENLLDSRVGDKVPFMWVFDCFASYAGLCEALAPDVSSSLSIGDLLINPENPLERLPAFALLLLRHKTEFPLPAEDTELQSGDRILFAGQRGLDDAQRRFLLEPSPLAFVRTGVEPTRSWLFRRFGAKQGAPDRSRKSVPD